LKIEGLRKTSSIHRLALAELQPCIEEVFLMPSIFNLQSQFFSLKRFQMFGDALGRTFP